jgi:hypothetical protein
VPLLLPSSCGTSLESYHSSYCREVRPLYKVVPQSAASVGGAMMGSSHVYDLHGAVPVAVGNRGGPSGKEHLFSFTHVKRWYGYFSGEPRRSCIDGSTSSPRQVCDFFSSLIMADLARRERPRSLSAKTSATWWPSTRPGSNPPSARRTRRTTRQRGSSSECTPRRHNLDS